MKTIASVANLTRQLNEDDIQLLLSNLELGREEEEERGRSDQPAVFSSVRRANNT